MKNLLALFVVLIAFSTSAQAQEIDLECDPEVVTWHPHPYSCTRVRLFQSQYKSFKIMTCANFSF